MPRRFYNWIIFGDFFGKKLHVLMRGGCMANFVYMRNQYEIWYETSFIDNSIPSSSSKQHTFPLITTVSAPHHHNSILSSLIITASSLFLITADPLKIILSWSQQHPLLLGTIATSPPHHNGILSSASQQHPLLITATSPPS
jgi:hypothetical protein